MKILALTNLILLLAIKSVSACSYAITLDPNHHKSFAQEYSFYLLLGSIFLVIPITLFYFKRGRKGIGFVILGWSSIILSIPVFVIYSLMDMCGTSASNVFLFDFIIMNLILISQIFNWKKGNNSTKLSLH